MHFSILFQEIEIKKLTKSKADKIEIQISDLETVKQ